MCCAPNDSEYIQQHYITKLFQKVLGRFMNQGIQSTAIPEIILGSETTWQYSQIYNCLEILILLPI